jgi:hypothetical protein
VERVEASRNLTPHTSTRNAWMALLAARARSPRIAQSVALSRLAGEKHLGRSGAACHRPDLCSRR